MTKSPDFFSTSIHRAKLDGPLQGARRMKVPYVPTEKRPLILSISELIDFLRCRLRWNWKYRVGLQQKTMGAERGIGIVVHEGKDQWYQYKPKKRTISRMERIARKVVRDIEIKKKDKELAQAMLIGFSEWANDRTEENSDPNIGKRIVYPEYPFVLPLTEDRTIWIRGKIDERFEPSIYKRVLAMDETKTRKTISFDMMDMSAQMTAYLWAMSVIFPDFKRYIAWRTVIRRQMPGPRVKAALFGRDSIERTDEELQMWLVDTRRQARDILDAAIYPNKTDACRWDCDFYNLCLVRAVKSDLKHTIRTEYTQK